MRMRRTAVVASAFTAVLLSAAACGTGSGAPSAASSSASTLDRKATCASFTSLQASAGMKMITGTNTLLTATAEADEAKRQEAMTKGLAALKESAAEYKAGLSKEAAQAGDAELKALLTTAATGMAQFDDQLSKVSAIKNIDDIPEIENKEAEDALDKLLDLCNK